MNTTTDRIHTIISQLAEQHRVSILYTCESGSRAWGFASPDSDFDVRFIYVRPQRDYLSIREIRDVIEYPVDSVLDIGGWDLRKALRLLVCSNAPLIEWLQSPIVYRATPNFAREMLTLAHLYFSPRAAIHHYISMAVNAFSELQSEQVKLKRYFYALRPLLAALWIVQTRSVPPMEFYILRQIVHDSTLNTSIDELLELKSRSNERDTAMAIPLLNRFIADTIQTCNSAVQHIEKHRHDTEAADEFFRRWLASAGA